MINVLLGSNLEITFSGGLLSVISRFDPKVICDRQIKGVSFSD